MAEVSVLALDRPLPEVRLPALAFADRTPGPQSEIVDPSDPNGPRFTLEGLGHAVAVIQQQRAQGKGLHAMPPTEEEPTPANPDAKRLLGTLGGLLTTVEVRPMTRRGHRREMRTGRAQTRLADQGRVALGRTEFANAGPELAARLDQAFDPVFGVMVHNVHVIPSSWGDTVATGRVDFVVSAYEEAARIVALSQAWVRTSELDGVYPAHARPVRRPQPNMPWHDVDTSLPGWTELPGLAWAASIAGHDEYMNRELGNTMAQIEAQADYDEHGFYQPPDKRSLPYWDGQETFPPVIAARWQRRNQRYREIEGWVSTGLPRPGHLAPDMMPVAKDPAMLGSEVAPALEVVRDALRPTIKKLRGELASNLEENPNPKLRPPHAAGVNLKRDKVMRLSRRYGPGMPYAATTAELTVEKAKAYLYEFNERRKAHPIRTILVSGLKAVAIITKSALGGWIGNVVDGAIDQTVEHLPGASEKGGTLLGDFVTWRHRRRLVVEGLARIDRFTAHLAAEHARLRSEIG